ncbi:Retrovirus-related Pol polyprotein from transposon TNT 1-94 [Araneus ventricosus]|uniref:Retrovirus-related Pol polyprotein from transposon TNT 1-94 n=1 Tax=Araneus ventricosus TaxID=182803 RepID=A0A4Y2H1F6_ARAVE|nr:Retrovirus-related Pol polyprotein from transposon TNT 1-94 [Araneus ventricosus]
MTFKFSGGAIAWVSKRQKCRSLYTTEAEFVAASQTCKEVILLYRLYMEIHQLQYVPVRRYDNQSTIRLIKNPQFHNQTKHIDVQYKFVRDKHQNKELNLQYCENVNQAGY